MLNFKPIKFKTDIYNFLALFNVKLSLKIQYPFHHTLKAPWKNVLQPETTSTLAKAFQKQTCFPLYFCLDYLIQGIVKSNRRKDIKGWKKPEVNLQEIFRRFLVNKKCVFLKFYEMLKHELKLSRIVWWRFISNKFSFLFVAKIIEK